MKKIARATIACLATCMAFGFYSCDDKTVADELNPEYADFTVEENKTNLENQGIAVLEKMDAMKNMEAAASIESLMSLLDMGQQDEIYYEISPLLAPLTKANKNIMAIAAMRASSTAMDSLTTLFRERGGVYTFNATDSSFTRVASTTQIKFEFPIGTSLTNNGSLTIDNYTYKYATNADFAGMEMPKTLNFSLKNGNTSLLSIALTASYNDDDLPSAESTVITFKEGYSFSQAATYDPSKVSWNFDLAYNNDKFFQGGFDMDGTLAYDSLATVYSENDFMERLLNSATASVQLGNIKAVGQVTYAQLLKDVDAFNKKYGTGPKSEATSEQMVDEQCSILNKNIKANLIYADTKQAIAKLSFYKETFQYGEQTYYDFSTKASFADGTAMDDSFFDEGFTGLKTAWETFVADMMESYGIEPPVEDENNYDDYPYQPY